VIFETSQFENYNTDQSTEEKFMIVHKLVHTNIKIIVRSQTHHQENLSALSPYLETQKVLRIQ
jgi:hypothetical protein